MKFESLRTYYDKSMNLIAKISFDKEILLFGDEDINEKPELFNLLPQLLNLEVRSGVDGSRFKGIYQP